MVYGVYNILSHTYVHLLVLTAHENPYSRATVPYGQTGRSRSRRRRRRRRRKKKKKKERKQVHFCNF
jgi:hypothetical protein